MSARFLDPAALLPLGNLQLRARTVAEGALSGLHRSAHHGASVEFAEHKEYAPGDELRHIDWRAYGRVDKFYVKRFEEETEVRGYLLVDASGSMGYAGDRQNKLSTKLSTQRSTKLSYAAVLAASLAYLLLRQNDQAGLMLLGGHGPAESYLPPRGHGAHLMDLCAALERLEPGGGSDLPRALSYLSELVRRRSLVIVLSDLLPQGSAAGEPGAQAAAEAVDIEGFAALIRARLKGLRARRHDVIVLHVLDPDELELPFEGTTWFEDMELPPGTAGARLLVDPADVRRVYQAELQRYLDDMRRGLSESDVEYHRVRTDQPPERVLLDLLTGPLRGKVRR